ncbi:hypothetical protein [Colwellia sp. PAMC 21821]|uniref:hypothetical protein n=1 Tax=Colwellia sp. PAMC 21821 TaxID=1816219 RepID=UPI0009BED30A|nr:hypothetical protein [Colwellia sp. PAMC 21821]ARD43201.1 hypothetical protein A3Q33_02035 [Colwellia sp. PAMC 21821]
MKKLLVSAALLSLSSVSTFAAETTENTVVYEAKLGFAETLAVSQAEQLGRYRIVLKPIKGSEFKAGNLIAVGIARGLLNPDFTANHIFINKDRTGALYTENDAITAIYAGDPTCDNGTGTVPFEVEETLNFVAGTGIYAGIEPGSFIVMKGVINNCPSLPEFGQNNFEVVGGTVRITQ